MTVSPWFGFPSNRNVSRQHHSNTLLISIRLLHRDAGVPHDIVRLPDVLRGVDVGLALLRSVRLRLQRQGGGGGFVLRCRGWVMGSSTLARVFLFVSFVCVETDQTKPRTRVVRVSSSVVLFVGFPGSCVWLDFCTYGPFPSRQYLNTKQFPPRRSNAARRFCAFSEARLGNLGSLDKHDLSVVRGEDALSYLALQLEAGPLRPERLPGGISTQRRGCAKRKSPTRIAYSHLRCFWLSCPLFILSRGRMGSTVLALLS